MFDIVISVYHLIVIEVVVFNYIYLEMDQAPLGNLIVRQLWDPKLDFTSTTQINGVFSFEQVWFMDLTFFIDHFEYDNYTIKF